MVEWSVGSESPCTVLAVASWKTENRRNGRVGCRSATSPSGPQRSGVEARRGSPCLRVSPSYKYDCASSTEYKSVYADPMRGFLKKPWATASERMKRLELAEEEGGKKKNHTPYKVVTWKCRHDPSDRRQLAASHSLGFSLHTHVGRAKGCSSPPCRFHRGARN
jgi:hypothetical protein